MHAVIGDDQEHRAFPVARLARLVEEPPERVVGVGDRRFPGPVRARFDAILRYLEGHMITGCEDETEERHPHLPTCIIEIIFAGHIMSGKFQQTGEREETTLGLGQLDDAKLGPRRHTGQHGLDAPHGTCTGGIQPLEENALVSQLVEFRRKILAPEAADELRTEALFEDDHQVQRFLAGVRCPLISQCRPRRIDLRTRLDIRFAQNDVQYLVVGHVSVANPVALGISLALVERIQQRVRRIQR